MKYLIIFLFCISSISNSCGQRIDSISYIIIKIKTNWDYTKKSNFCSLDIEKGNKYASELYFLVNYQNTAPQTDAVYSIEKNKEKAPNSSKNFNYFINVTEAFNYLAKFGWYLENVFTNISTEPESTVEGGEVFYYPKITSEPVYIFKKIVN